MRSQLRFVMHPDDEFVFLKEILNDDSVVLVDGPRWRSSSPETTREISSIGRYCIVWSHEDLTELTAEYIQTCGDWYCRSEHSTIQFLRSSLSGEILTEGRIAVSTDAAEQSTARRVERRYRKLSRMIKGAYSNSVVCWQDTQRSTTPTGPRYANPSAPDPSLWVGPAAMIWLLSDRARRVTQYVENRVEGVVKSSP